MSKIINIYFENTDNGEDEIINISNIDTKYPDTDHYQKQAKILTYYSILDPVENTEDSESKNLFLPGRTFPNMKIGSGPDYESKYKHESYWHICKHINTITAKLQGNSNITTGELLNEVTGWNSREPFEELLYILEKYSLIMRITRGSPSDEEEENTESLKWGIGIQNNKDTE